MRIVAAIGATLGQLLAVHVTPANEQERAPVAEFAASGPAVMGQTLKVAFSDRGYAGKEAAQTARNEGIELQVIKLEEAKKVFVPLPRRWVVERSWHDRCHLEPGNQWPRDVFRTPCRRPHKACPDSGPH